MDSILGWENSLEVDMENHSSILTWRIPWAEEPGGLDRVHRVAKSQPQLKQLILLLSFSFSLSK